MSATQVSPRTFHSPSLWRRPELTVARFTLSSYLKSGWLLLDIVFIWLLYAAFFLDFGGNVTYFFTIANNGLGAITILGTAILVRRAMQARIYLHLAHLSSRATYIRGVILAAIFLRIPLYLLMLLLGGGYHRYAPSFGIQGATIGNILAGSMGTLLITIVVVVLTVVLSRPIATRLIQILFLLWLVLLLTPQTNPYLAPFLALTHLPIAPLAACYNLANSGIGWYQLLMLVIAIGYIVGLAWLAEYWLAKRDLILV